jgi:hypothetical protein
LQQDLYSRAYHLTKHTIGFIELATKTTAIGAICFGSIYVIKEVGTDGLINVFKSIFNQPKEWFEKTYKTASKEKLQNQIPLSMSNQLNNFSMEDWKYINNYFKSPNTKIFMQKALLMNALEEAYLDIYTGPGKILPSTLKNYWYTQPKIKSR